MITVLSFFTDNLRDIGQSNSLKWKQYCDIHGYKWNCSVSECIFHPFWQKIDYIVKQLNNSSDDLLWTDIDVTIKHPTYDLEDIQKLSKKDILISSDKWGLCAGFMFIRNIEWTRHFYEQVLRLGDLDIDYQKRLYTNILGDQNTIKYLYDGFESVRNHFFLLEQNVVSCPLTSNPTAPFHHWWINGGRNTDPILKELKNGALRGI